MIRTIGIIAVCVGFGVGCGTYRNREKVDMYEAVKIDELRGNKVSRGILDRRTLWLNARREIHPDDTKAYFLITELTPSPDFTLQASGESLVLLVDGVRHAYAATNSLIPYAGRRGIVSTLYRVPPELLVKIANAQEVLVRLKGTTSVIDEVAPPSVMRHFRKWLLERFTPEPPAVGGAHMAVTGETSTALHDARRLP